MRIDFETLWVVLDPTPNSELCDILWRPGGFYTFESALMGARMVPGGAHSARNPVLYTDEAEARADAEQRIAARDRDAWVTLASLPPGALFRTRDGGKFVRTIKQHVIDEWTCVNLNDGLPAYFSSDSQVCQLQKP